MQQIKTIYCTNKRGRQILCGQSVSKLDFREFIRKELSEVLQAQNKSFQAHQKELQASKLLGSTWSQRKQCYRTELRQTGQSRDGTTELKGQV